VAAAVQYSTAAAITLLFKLGVSTSSVCVLMPKNAHQHNHCNLPFSEGTLARVLYVRTEEVAPPGVQRHTVYKCRSDHYDGHICVLLGFLQQMDRLQDI
jgi:hypothetical protein